MENINCQDQYNPPTWLPPGFRFHPTDEELITYYLARKVADAGFRDHAVTEVDLNKHEPWDLPGKAQMMGDKQWYFFSRKDKKYPSGSRTNRATEAGYWKATGKDKEVFMKSMSGRKQVVGMKKTLVFYEGRAPRGLKSNWVMHEYRIDEHASIASILGNTSFTKLQGRKEEWVICRVFCKKLRHSLKREYNDHIKDAELLARFLLADDQQLPLDMAATPLNLAGADDLAAAEKWGCSSSTPSRSETCTSTDLLTSSSQYSSLITNDCFNSTPAATDHYNTFQSPSSSTHHGPLPRFPSDLESFWLHASAFLP